MKIKYTTRFKDAPQVSESEKSDLSDVVERFPFRTNTYYDQLINWSDADDPLRRIVYPSEDERIDWGHLDASDEGAYQPVPGLEHKYHDTALLLCNDTCAAYCRFCFRKRLFQKENDEVVKDVSMGISYIKSHTEINNVLLTGGDPLILSTRNLRKIIDPLMEIDHLRNIRIGTKVPAFNPFRIIEDPELFKLIESVKSKRVYILTQFNHPRELTAVASQSVSMLMQSGATVVNQTPMISKVNDSSSVLSELFNTLSNMGILSYYVFACRPTNGNRPFIVPIEKAFEIFKAAQRLNSGLAKTARFVMSHSIGKIEVIGREDNFMFFKYHNLVDQSLNGTIVFAPCNEKALWFDDYSVSGGVVPEAMKSASYVSNV